MTKKIALLLILAFLFFSPLALATAAPESPIPISVLVREDCQHCQDEKEFLKKLQETRKDIAVLFFNIDTEEGKQMFAELTAREKLSKSTPITLVGNTIVQGFGAEETTGKRIRELVEKSVGEKTLTLPQFLAEERAGTVIEKVEAGTCDNALGACPANDGGNDLLVSLPFFGAVDLRAFSLPVIASLLGFVDGFNPCAMWVLVMFLLALIEIGDRRLMWKVAGLFIAAETIMYYLILNVWFTTWDFIGLDRIVTPIVGFVAIAAGGYFLFEGMKNRDGTCAMTNHEQRRSIRTKIKNIAESPFTILTAMAIIGLALSVNIIEFACSIGIPQTFTKIIDLNQLSWLQTQGLMALYIFFYMIDDFFVFGIALWGASHLHLTAKYSRISHLLGGALMILLGLLLIFSPESLHF